LRGLPLGVALISCVAYLVFVGVMVVARGSTDVVWSRLVFLFGSLQALAFAAAGALWGTSVQQERVASAERRAAVSALDATRGRALAATMKAEAKIIVDRAGGTYRGGAQAGPQPGDDIDTARRHAAIAAELFPDA
jgi:hypothetical protein